MKPIKMVDLVSQYQEIESEVDAAIKGVIESSTFIKGPAVREFEKNLGDYLGTSNVISCGNGTDALQIAMMGLDFQPGDEVIVPSFTYVATVEVIALLGLTPVFVDVDPDLFTLDPEKLEDAITDKTKGLVVVHLFGQCADMNAILPIAAKHGIKVIEDNAQAIGSDYTNKDGIKKKAGLMGNVGTTSFFPTKNLGCYGDGGAMTTDDEVLAEKLTMISNHGQKRKYYHDIVGVNSRLDTLQAAILNEKLKHLDAYCTARVNVAASYDAALVNLASISTPKRNEDATHVYHQYTLKVHEGRDDLKSFLNDRGIPSMIYYPVAQHLQVAYLKYGYFRGSFPVSEGLCDVVLSLPIHTHLEEDQIQYICESITTWSNGN